MGETTQGRKDSGRKGKWAKRLRGERESGRNDPDSVLNGEHPPILREDVEPAVRVLQMGKSAGSRIRGCMIDVLTSFCKDLEDRIITFHVDSILSYYE